jgi:hypothetical protein
LKQISIPAIHWQVVGRTHPIKVLN